MAKKTIKIVVDAGGAQRAIGNVQSKLKETGNSADITTGRIKTLSISAKALGGAVAAITAVAAATVKFSAEVANAVTQMDNMAKRANVSAQTFQAWELAAGKVGVSGDTLSQTFQDLADRTGEFTKSGGKSGEMLEIYDQYLKNMGVSVDDLREMKPDELLNLIYKGMTDAGASANEMTAAFEQVASNSSWLIPILDGTGESVNKVKDAMRRDGRLIEDEDIEKARILDEQSKELGKTWDSIKTNIGLAAAEPATNFLKFLDDAIVKTQQLAKDTGVAMSAFGRFLSTDAQLENIKKMNTFSGDDSAPSIIKPVNKNALLSGFGYEVESPQDSEEIKKEEEKKDITAEIEQEKLDIKKAALQEWYDTVLTYNASETELLDIKRQEELDKLDEWYAVNLEKKDEYLFAMSEIDQKYKDIELAQEEKQKKAKEKADADVARSKMAWDKQLQANNMRIASQSLDLIASTAKEGSAIQIAAMLASKALAITQVMIQFEIAKATAMAQLGPIAGPPIVASMEAQRMMSIALIGASAVTELASSRQSGGYMSANTPYQVGGGAHTSDPELYSSGGKSYIVDSQAGMMKRVSGSTSGGGSSSVQVVLNNNGEPMAATVARDSINEDGVRQIVMEMTPDILRNESANPDSQFNQGRQANESINWSYK